MGKRKKKDEVTIKFISNSAVDVTGSGVMISYKDRDYLLEFGAVQGFGGTIEKEYMLNYQYSRNINIDNLKCIFVSHQNYDHIGLIPSLVSRGFQGEIFGSYESLEFSKKILFDSAFIINRTVENIKAKGKKIEPLYKESDVARTTDYMISRDINRVYQYDEYMSYQFVPTNHLTGSCQIIIWIKKDNGNTVKIHYTGDLGNNSNKSFKSFLRDTEIVPTSNIIISECTYFGDLRDYTKHEAKLEREDMKKEIMKTLSKGGKVVIPAFAMQRSQDIMGTIYDFFKNDKDFNYPVYVDGNLTAEINNTFLKVLKDEELDQFNEMYHWRNFKFLRQYKESIACISKREPCISICSSGMGISGHSVEWIKSCIDCSKDKIIIVGYIPEGSNLDKLYKKEQKTLTWDKHTYQIKCEVIKYSTFSSHKGAMDIVNMMKQINTGMIVYHHGSKTAKHNAVEITKEELMNIGKTTKVLESYRGMEIKL